MIKRRRRSRDEWDTLIAEFHASGINAEDFCQQHDVGRMSFDKWRLRFSRTAPSGFAELTSTPTCSAAPVEPSSTMAIALGDVRLELPGNTPAVRVVEFMRALARA